MRLSVSSYSFTHYLDQTGARYFEICDIAKQMGFDGIEFTTLSSKYFDKEADELAMAEALRAYCESIGLEICAYAVGADIFANRQAAVEEVCAHVDAARALGAKLLRFDVCYSLPADCSHDQAIEQMAPYIRQIADYAQGKGVRVCTENHGYVFQAPDVVERLMLAVDHANYGWLCDVGNFLCVDADPESAVATAMTYCCHVHFKDFLWESRNKPRPTGYFGTLGGNHLKGTMLGHGIVPLESCAAILKRSGYDGWVSLEFEGTEDCLTAISEGLAFLKAHVL